MNGKSHTVNFDNFKEMLQIYPKLPGQKFKDPPVEEEILSFIRELGHTNLVFQVENKNSKKNNDMYYPRFTKVIVEYFMEKDKDTEVYGALLPQHLTNQAMLESKAYKTYHAYATGEKTPKPKYVQKKADSDTSPKKNNDEDDDDADDQSDDDKDDDDDSQGDDNQDDDNEQTESDNDGDDFLHPKLSTFDEEERHDEKQDEEEEGLDLRVQAPSHFESTNDEAYDDVTQGVNVEEEKLCKDMTNEKEVDELYNDVNINLKGRDTEMTDASFTNVQATQVIEDTHCCIDSILNLNTESTSLVNVHVTTNLEMPPSSATTLPPPPIPLIQPQQQTPIPSPAIVQSISLQNLPTFGSLFKFKDRLKALEDDFSEFKQTNLFAKTVSSIPGIVDAYLAKKMNEDVKTVIQLQLDRLRDEAQAKNKDFINKLDENIKKIIKEQVKVQVKEKVSKILPRIDKLINDLLELEVLTCTSNKAKTSHAIAANLSELELKKILIDKMKSNKSIHRLVQQKTLYKALIDAYETDKVILDTYRDTVMIKRRRDDEDDDEEPFVGSNQGSKRRRARKEPESTSEPKGKTSKSTGKSTEGSKSHQKSTGKSAQAEEPIFTVDDLEEPAPQEFDIVGPTFKLMKGSCKSLVELEYFLEEVYKETTDQLDWNNPEGRQYPHDLRKPLPLIPNSQCRRVIPFDHFINNDLAHLRGGASSRTYATSVTKTKAADYGYIKWIEDLVPSTLESARDVYSRKKIIAITKL
nr:hypothetical protein [Tanacetum cinerariifolium]